MTFHVMGRLDDLPLPAGWVRRRYRVASEMVGVLQAEAPAETLNVPLCSSGWQEIHVGLFRPRGGQAALQVKLASERHWRSVQPMILCNDPGGALQDAVLGVLNLSTEEKLLIRPMSGRPACLAYVRCVPSAPPPPRVHHRNVGAIIDGADAMHQYCIEGPDDLAAVVHSFADSDFDRLCWGTAAGTFRALYFSEVTEYLGQGQTRFGRAFDEDGARVMANFARRGQDPLKVLIAASHAEGLQLWADHRICHAFPPGQFDDAIATRFYLDNQHMRVRDMDGTPNHQAALSLAYPEFRDWTVRFLTEQAKIGVDGIHIDFTRKDPIIGWEPAVYDSFKAKYGKDPKTWKGSRDGWLSDWLEHQSGFVTQLLRDLRRSLDLAGRRIPVSVQIPEDFRINALDVGAWAREGLVDIATVSDRLWCRDFALDPLRTLVTGTKCEAWGCIHQRHPACFPTTPGPGLGEAWVDPWRVARLAADYYNQGADGIYLWEAGTAPAVLQRWNVIRNLGDRETLAKMFGHPIGPYDGRNAIEQFPLEPSS